MVSAQSAGSEVQRADNWRDLSWSLSHQRRHTRDSGISAAADAATERSLPRTRTGLGGPLPPAAGNTDNSVPITTVVGHSPEYYAARDAAGIATPAKSKQRAARYTIDLDAAAAKTGEQLPWYGAARAYWQAKLGNSEEAQFAIATLLSNLDKSTAATYRSQWNTFEIKFCQPRGLTPIPASRETILSYLGWHAKRGTVQGASLDNYLTVINRAHKDCDLPGPALNDPAQTAILTGMAKLQIDANPTDQRLYVPNEHFSQLLDYGLDAYKDQCGVPDSYLSQPNWKALSKIQRRHVEDMRDCVAIVFNFADFGRSDTQSNMKAPDIGIDDQGQLIFRLRKVKGRSKKKTNLTFQWPADSKPDVIQLTSWWLEIRDQLAFPKHGFMWKCPWETARFTNSSFDAMLQRTLTKTGFRPPDGFSYLPHSIRAAAASGAAAIDVTLPKIRHEGGWSRDSAVVHDYIDPSCPPTAAAFRFFGHLKASPQTSGM